MNIRHRTMARVSLVVIMIIFLSSNIMLATEGKEKKKYQSWQEVALDMAKEFDQATANVEANEYKEAYQYMNKAYFGYYESEGFEKNVMYSISRKRVSHIEARFSDIKHTLLGNKDGDKQSLLEEIENLKVKVYRDAMVLDGAIGKNAPDIEGIAVYGEQTPPATMTLKADVIDKKEEQKKIEEDESNKKSETQAVNQPVVDSDAQNWQTFTTAFVLLLREGLEAILVIVAIIAYLVKTGNKKMCKSVYLGVVAAIIASMLLAWILDVVLGGSGVAQELIEGWTMFLAVAILFYVSHWMLSKSEAEAWQKYIDDKVQQSIDKKSQATLVFAAFLAVLREGAELILFYKAAFSSGRSNPYYITYGIVVGTLVLAVIYVLFRYTTVKLPLKPFFIFTSVLLFLMCISFMGKGVMELTEANVISGQTMIPALEGFNIDLLNITNRAETLIPQIMLAIASVWLLLSHTVGGKKKQKTN